MLAVCFYRGSLDKYKEHEKIKRVIEETKGADLLITPIADNKMFYTMSQFAEGEINSLAALHSLSASNLGLQYVLKTSRAIDRLVPIERYYLSKPERENRRLKAQERALAIDTKLKMAKREFRDGPYTEEIFR